MQLVAECDRREQEALQAQIPEELRAMSDAELDELIQALSVSS